MDCFYLSSFILHIFIIFYTHTYSHHHYSHIHSFVFLYSNHMGIAIPVAFCNESTNHVCALLALIVSCILISFTFAYAQCLALELNAIQLSNPFGTLCILAQIDTLTAGFLTAAVNSWNGMLFTQVQTCILIFFPHSYLSFPASLSLS